MTTFCWLPPEREETGWETESRLMARRSEISVVVFRSEEWLRTAAVEWRDRVEMVVFAVMERGRRRPSFFRSSGMRPMPSLAESAGDFGEMALVFSEEDFPGGGSVGGGDGAEGFGASGADESGDAEDFPFVDGEGNAFHGGAGAEVFHTECGAVLAGGDVWFALGEFGTGHFADELRDAGFGNLVGGDAAAIAEDGDAVGDAGDLVHAVGDVNHGDPALFQSGDVFEESLDFRTGEGGGGFVEDEDGGVIR